MYARSDSASDCPTHVKRCVNRISARLAASEVHSRPVRADSRVPASRAERDLVQSAEEVLALTTVCSPNFWDASRGRKKRTHLPEMLLRRYVTSELALHVRNIQCSLPTVATGFRTH